MQTSYFCDFLDSKFNMQTKSMSQYQDDKGQDMMGNMTQQSVLNAFDFSAIEEMDPSLGKYRNYAKIWVIWTMARNTQALSHVHTHDIGHYE